MRLTDVTLEGSGLWQGTGTGAGDTATLAQIFFWLQPVVLWIGEYCLYGMDQEFKVVNHPRPNLIYLT